VKKQTIVAIGKNEFRITPFDPFRQLKLFGDLQKEILPAVGGVLNAALTAGDAAQADDAAGIAAFRDLSTKFDGAQLLRWSDLLIDPEYVYVAIEGADLVKVSKSVRDEAFEDFSEVLELLFHIGKVNFAAPLTRWAGLSGLAQKAMAKLSANSEPTSSKSS
jgi:hypothetical protein